MKLDILANPPKYCPQCDASGTKTKVKKFRMKDGSRVLMCKSDKCPWPFSEYSREEVTIKEVELTDSPKKRKDRASEGDPRVSPDHKRHKALDQGDSNDAGKVTTDVHEIIVPGDDISREAETEELIDATGLNIVTELSEKSDAANDHTIGQAETNADNINRLTDASDNTAETNSDKHSEHSKLETAFEDHDKDQNVEPMETDNVDQDGENDSNVGDIHKPQVSTELPAADNDDIDTCDVELTVLERVVAEASDEVATDTGIIVPNLAAEATVQAADKLPTAAAAVQASENLPAAVAAVKLTDSDFFKAVPVAVRQPIRVPRHAAHILDSRMQMDKEEEEENDQSELESVASDGADASDFGDLDDFNDLEGSDTELESLVSECSTMSTVSDVSIGQQGGKGAGKVKRRGKKKKRKDRRKIHTEKCSKNMQRRSDISAVFTENPLNINDKKIHSVSSLEQKVLETSDGSDQRPLEEPRSTESASHQSPRDRDLTTVQVTSVSDERTVEVVTSVSDFTLNPVVNSGNDVTMDEMTSVSEVKSGQVEDTTEVNVDTADRFTKLVHKDEEIEVNIMPSPLPADGSGDIRQRRIGTGSRCAQFSFYDTVTKETTVFPPVFVEDAELEHLVNVVIEQATKYKIKEHKIQQEPEFESLFLLSRSKLDRDVIKHVEKCFTRRKINAIRKAERPSRKSARARKQNRAAAEEQQSPRVQRKKRSPRKQPEPSQPSPLGNSDDENLDPEDLFKRPLEPVRTYQTTKSVKVSPNPYLSPRAAVPMSPGRSEPMSKYCFVLSDPLSPMPATPKSIHDGDGGSSSADGHAMARSQTSSVASCSSQEEESIVPDMLDSSSFQDSIVDDIAGDESQILEVVGGEAAAAAAATEDSVIEDLDDLSAGDVIRQKMEQLEQGLGESAGDSKADAKMSVMLNSLSNRLMMQTGIDIRITAAPPVQEQTAVRLPTLSLIQFGDDDDPEYQRVLKIGVGTREMPPPPFITEPSGGDEKTNCVLHVAESASISLPDSSDILEIQEQGSNTIFLTAESDQIEANSLKLKANAAANVKQVFQRRQNHRRTTAANKPIQRFGRGWFFWKDWKVDKDLIRNFATYVHSLCAKWQTTPQTGLRMEKKVSMAGDNIDDIIDFFDKIFMKISHLKNVYGFGVEDALDFVRGRLALDNNSFVSSCVDVLKGRLFRPEEVNLADVLSKATIQKLSNPDQPPAGYKQQLPPEVAVRMNAAACVKKEPGGSGGGSGGGADAGQQPASVLPVGTSSSQHKPIVVKSEREVHERDTYGTSVAVLDSVQPESNAASRIGSGDKCLQIFYENPVDGTKVTFKPVYVSTDLEVNLVVALVNEKTADYKHKIGLSKKPMVYYADAVRARTELENPVVRFIEQCFTKKGMKELRTDYKRRNYPVRRNKIVRLKSLKNEMAAKSAMDEPQGRISSDEEFGTEVNYSQQAVEEQRQRRRMKHDHNAWERVNEDETQRVLEERVFGGRLPRVRNKPRRKPRRAALADSDSDEDQNPSQQIVMSTVDYMLDPTEDGGEDEDADDPDDITAKEGRHWNKIKVSSLFKATKKKPRARVRRDSSNNSSLSEEDEDFFENRKSFFRSKEDASARRSIRLQKKYAPDQEVPKPMAVAEAQDAEPEVIQNPNPLTHVKKEKVRFPKDVTEQDIDEMVRSLSRNSGIMSRAGGYTSQENSRPGSQAEERNSRPSSKSPGRAAVDLSPPLVRPESRLLNKSRKHFGFTIDKIEDPDRDSPVLTPRRRRQEKEKERIGQLPPRCPSVIGVKPMPESKEAEVTPPPPEDDVPAPSTTSSSAQTTSATETSSSLPMLQQFDQINVRKSKHKKVAMLLEKQKRKAEKNERKKLLGFGQKKEANAADAAEAKLPKGTLAKAKLHVKKKAQVSKQESDLIKFLLETGEKAVVQAQTERQTTSSSITSVQEGTVVSAVQSSAASTFIMDFEQAQGMTESEEGLFNSHHDELNDILNL